jgi:LCP family protein required for cell wall assembly
MIEEELRDSFARHEVEAPDVDVLRRGIVRLTARRRRRRRTVWTGAVAATVAIVLLAVPLIVQQVKHGRLPVIAPAGTVDLPQHPLNILVLGLVPAGTAGDQSPGSDSITLVHISADYRHAYLVDFERDVVVPIPGHGVGKISSAYRFGGAPLAVQVVQSLTGATIDGAVVLTLDALRDVTDAVGGIRICLPNAVTSIHTGHTFMPGCYELDGTDVADLVRQRQDQPVGAYTRDANIHRVMMGLVTRIHSLNLLADAGRIAALLRVNGLRVDMGTIDTRALAVRLKNVDGSDLVGIVSPRFQTSDDGLNQRLDPVVTPEMFTALREDRLDSFVIDHPDWVVGH